MSKNLPLFIIIYTDGSKYLGKEGLLDTGWSGAPINKPIERIFLRLPDNNVLTLQDYEKYNILVEGTKDVLRVRGKSIKEMNAIPRIEYIYFMGLKNGRVTSYRVTMFEGKPGKDKFKKGDFTRREYELGKEWYGKPTTGWR